MALFGISVSGGNLVNIMGTTSVAETITTDFLDQVIKILLIDTPMTLAGQFWWLVTTVWSAYWPYILVFIIGWTIWELITRNGGFHYNSENGFSPTYNRFVGSGVLLLFQMSIYAILTKLFGHEAYLQVWSYSVHIVAFLSTGLFLNLVGFWKYWKLPRL